MGSIKDYKKAIIYSIIILLLLTIMILPPLFRKTMPKKIPTPEELAIKTYLICEKETEQYKAISTTEYRDNVEYSNTIVYTRITDKDITDEEVINEINFLHQVLGTIYKHDTEKGIITITIDKITRDDNNSNIDFIKYLQSKDEEQSFFESKGYTCKTTNKN